MNSRLKAQAAHEVRLRGPGCGDEGCGPAQADLVAAAAPSGANSFARVHFACDDIAASFSYSVLNWRSPASPRPGQM